MMRTASVMAVLLCTIACGGSGDDDGGQALEGEAAVQAAAQAAISLGGAIQALLDDPSSGLTAGAAATAGEPMRGSRAIELACERGGVVDGECREEGGRTIVESRSRDCRIFDDALGIEITSNGESNATFAATGICGSSTIPADVESTLELRGYREEWRQGSTLIRVIEASRFDQSRRPNLVGCSVNDGEALLDGDLRIEGPGFDWSLGLGDLRFAVSSAGNPCEESAVIDGLLEVDDGVRGSRFAASLDELRVDTLIAIDGVLEMAMAGPVDFDCLGRVDLTTGDRLALQGTCPVEGELGLALPGMSPATVSFSFDGLQLDYDSNGVADYSAAGCGAESLAVCR